MGGVGAGEKTVWNFPSDHQFPRKRRRREYKFRLVKKAFLNLRGPWGATAHLEGASPAPHLARGSRSPGPCAVTVQNSQQMPFPNPLAFHVRKSETVPVHLAMLSVASTLLF